MCYQVSHTFPQDKMHQFNLFMIKFTICGNIEYRYDRRYYYIILIRSLKKIINFVPPFVCF